jgi:hypothetical protein
MWIGMKRVFPEGLISRNTLECSISLQLVGDECSFCGQRIGCGFCRSAYSHIDSSLSVIGSKLRLMTDGFI